MTVKAHRELVSQALANLVDNAIKYAGEGSATPEVVISVEEKNGSVEFRVADNGAGIAEADRARVTERFVRLEESRSKPGAGLGLSLVSAVAQAARRRAAACRQRAGPCGDPEAPRRGHARAG